MDNKKLGILIVVVVIVACCCLAAVAAAALAGGLSFWSTTGPGNFDLGTVSAGTTHSSSFEVGSPARLVVDLDLGSVDIVASEQDVITVDAEIQAFGGSAEAAQARLDEIAFETSQDESTVTVTGRWSERMERRGRSPEIRVMISVPRETEVELASDVGEVRLEGTEGDVRIGVDVGRVEIDDVAVPGQLNVETGVAEIDFEGALTEGGAYTFTSDVGSIRLALPADSQFAIDASSNLGTVTIDFDVEGATDGDLLGRSVNGVVGGDSSTQVTLRSDIGPITVRRQ